MPIKKKNSKSAIKKPASATGRKGTVSKTISSRDKIKRTSTKKDIGELKIIRPSGAADQSFFELVYEVARQIPYGRVTSYGAIATVLGTKSSARVVGYAMNGTDKINPTVPAHRVVNRVGLLSGKHHFKPPGKMEKLLKKEGILVKDDTIVNFKEKFWDPSEEML